MNASWYWARATLRRNLRGAALVVLLVAVGGGATMALAAGARRTESSFRRLLALSNEPDAFVFAEDEAGVRRLVASPLVADSMVFAGVSLHPVGARCSSAAADYYPMALPLDDGDPYRMSRPRVLAGRLPRAGVATEVALPASIAARLRLGVGDELRLFGQGFPEACRDEATSARQPAMARLRIVGVIRQSYELGVAEGGFVATMLPFAFRAAHPDAPVDFPSAVVRLKEGPGGFAAFAAEAGRAGGGAEGGVTGEGGPLQPALDMAAFGLWVTAGVVALATLVALGIALLRQAGALSGDLRVLAALGLSRRGAAAGAVVPAGLALVLGVAGAVVVAVGASPSLPLGLGRQADPDLGVHADWAVLGAGALAALGAGLVLAGLTAWRAVRAAAEPDRDGGRRRPSRLANGLSRSGTPPWATIGTGYALGRGLGAGTRRGALPGAIVGVTGVLAVALFGLSLDRTRTDPGRYGWGQWDGVVSPEFSDEDATPEGQAADYARFEALILADPAVEAVSLVRFRTEVVLDGEPVLGLVLSPRRGRAGPTVLSGRLPTGRGEIALGSATARRLGKRIGERIDAAVIAGRQEGPDGEEPTGHEPTGAENASPTSVVKVVGIAAFPAVEDGLPLSDGFVLSNDEYAGLGGGEVCGGECFRNHAVALADGADGDAFAARMARRGAFVARPQPGAEIVRLDEVQSLPRILAILLGLLAGLGVAHTLWVTPRRRQRDLATLRTLGFTPVQVRRVLHTQAATLAIAGAAGGLVGGVLAGRLAWGAVAEAIGVPSDLDVRPLALVAVVVVALVGARLLAVIPGRVAGRATPAQGLREES